MKLTFISRAASGISQIGCLDEIGIVSVWNIIEIQGHINTEDDVNLSLGAKYKMILNYSDNLRAYPNVIDPFSMDDLNQGIEIEFDPAEPQIFFFSTSEGLFKVDKRQAISVPVKMDTIGLNSPTALSMSDRGYLLAAYSCGSIT
jgi:hypothetical protein